MGKGKLKKAYVCKAKLEHCSQISAFVACYFPLSGLGWLNLLQQTPFNKLDQEPSPGWVLIDNEDSSIVGFLGCVKLEYEWNGHRVYAAAMSAVAVKDLYRRYSLQLFSRFFQQSGIDLFLNTTANDTVGKVLNGFKAERVPRADYDRSFLWILNKSRFVYRILKERKIPGSHLWQHGGAVILKGHELLFQGKPYVNIKGNIEQITHWDDRFDDLWESLRQRRNVLQAVRTKEVLEWHFSLLRNENRLIVLGLEEGGVLNGYIVLIQREIPKYNIKRFIIADLQVRRDLPEYVEILVRSALERAKSLDIDIVEAIGFSDFKQDVFRRMAPIRRRFPTWPFYYKASDKVLRVHLGSSESWDPCLYDGDASFY